MWLFSTEIASFLKKLGLDQGEHVAMVPRNESCGKVGDFLIMRYSLGVGSGSKAQRLVMIVRPITKSAKTGNLLLTVVRVPPEQISSIQELQNLYRNRGIRKSKLGIKRFSTISKLLQVLRSGKYRSLKIKAPNLPDDDYRTYIMSKIYGPLLRLTI